MKCLSGLYWLPLYRYTCQKPDYFSLSFPNAVIEIRNKERAFEFCIKSDTADDDELSNLVYACEDGMSFFLDIVIGSSYSPNPQICDGKLSKRNRSDEVVSFEFLQTSVKIDFTETKISLNKVVNCSDLERFVSSLQDNELISHATSYYLKAIEEPEHFLILLYKAYEIIKDVAEIPKKEASKFRQLANDPSIFDGRHAKSSSLNLHGITPDEKDFCQSLIKKGILSIAKSFNRSF